MFDLVNTQGFPATAWSPFLVKKHKKCAVRGVLFLYIPKYILNFAAVLVLTLNTTLMKFRIHYKSSSDAVFFFTSEDPALYQLLRALVKCEIKSFTISLYEPEQKGGQYEQQPE